MLNIERIDEILEKFPTLGNILVLGDVGVDQYTCGKVNRISPEAPVPVLTVDRVWYKLGLAANVAENLKDLGVTSTLCGVIGDDQRASLFEDLLEEQGLKTWGIIRCQNHSTTFKERVTTETQQICRIDTETVTPLKNETEKILSHRLGDFVGNHQAVIIEDYAKGLISEKTCQKTIQSFRDAGKFVAIDPSRITPPHYYKQADLLKPNKTEAQLMVRSLGHREDDPKKMAEILLDKLNLKMVVITLGHEGMAMMCQKLGTYKRIPTVANEVFDVSGAGDTAISVIVSCLLAGASLSESCGIANAASSIVVSKKGTATVKRSELAKFCKDNYNCVSPSPIAN